MRVFLIFRLDDVRTSAILVIALRVISGMASGAIGPSANNLLGRWLPAYERSRSVTLMLSGQPVKPPNHTMIDT